MILLAALLQSGAAAAPASSPAIVRPVPAPAAPTDYPAPPAPPAPPLPPPLPPPPAPLPPPSARARALARATAPDLMSALAIERRESQRQSIELDLLYGGDDSRSTCDSNNAACREAASAMAREISDWRAERWTELSYDIYGRHYDRTMSAAEIDSALQFLATPAGKAFGAAQKDLWKALMRREDGVTLRAIENGTPYGEVDPRTAFDRRTANLPRRTPDTRPYLTYPPPIAPRRQPAPRSPTPPPPPDSPGGAAQPD